MMHFDEWWNSAAADSFRAKHEDLDGEVFRTVWDAAQLGQAAIKKAEGTADDQDLLLSVQIELLERIQESLGSYLSDHGWSQSDMDAADALDALDGFLAAAHPAEGVPSQTVPVGYVALAALTSRTHADDYAKCFATETALLENYPAAKVIAVFDHAATQPAAQGMDAADTTRLNWLDAQVKNHAVHNGFLWQEGGWESDRGLVCAIQDKKQKKTVRQAIDAALATQAKQGGAA